jgi:DNA-binding beta-propeller fold protein YncE
MHPCWASGKTQSRLRDRRRLTSTSMDISQPVCIGSDFLGYRIEELIGRGGMGVVYRAYDLRLKRPVALKLVAPSLARDQRFRERFARETELLMSLEHPNVVPIYDAGDVDDRVYLAMRLVDGSDLGALLRTEGPLEPHRAIAICAQIAAALDAAHVRGLVHRDVKPSNVLLDDSEHVYLADFGLTRRLDDEERGVGGDRSVGTPAYLAPEQLEGGPLDGGADVYSLGCVLYECLTGEPVFPRASRLAIAWAHLEEEPPRPCQVRAELPEGIDAVVARAMAKEPEQRYPSCGALIDAAGEALGLGKTQTAHRRRTLLLAAAVVLAIAVAAGTTATLVHGARRNAAPLRAGPNTLARINPATKRVDAVIKVGKYPLVVAGSGEHVWVYSEANGTISEIDSRTSRKVGKESVSPLPPAECCGVYSGPVLTADASGAWFVTGGLVRKAVLVHDPVGQPEKGVYPLDITPTGVAVGDGSVWVVGRTARDNEVLRIDPADGHVTRRTRFPRSARIDSIAYGYGAVWVVSSARSILYRIDPRSTGRPRKLVVSDSRATRPELIGGYVRVRVEGHDGLALWIRASSLVKEHWETDGPPNNREIMFGAGALWWYDSPSGTVVREAEQSGPDQRITPSITTFPRETIPVLDSLPAQGGPCLTSIAIAGGSVWVTASPLPGDAGSICQR